MDLKTKAEARRTAYETLKDALTDARRARIEANEQGDWYIVNEMSEIMTRLNEALDIIESSERAIA